MSESFECVFRLFVQKCRVDMYLSTQAITAYLCDFYFISLLFGEYVMQCVNEM